MAPNHSVNSAGRVAPPTAATGTTTGAGAGGEATKGLNVLIITPVYPPHVTVGGGVAVTCGALTDKLVKRGCTVRVLSPRLGNVDFGTSSLYPAFPVMFPTFHNLRLFYKSIKEADILVCPDNTVMPFLLFFSHLTGTPLFFNLHTNVRQLLEMTGPFGRFVSAPICDGFIKINSNLTARTFTTSPSYKDVLLERGYRVDGVFSPRIKLAIFERPDSEKEVSDARAWLSGNQSEKTVLIYAGRFSHEKRIGLLVKGKPENVVLAIVGDGPGPSGDAVARLHDPENDVFVHRGMVNQDRLRVLYKASDFLVSASSFETLGMTVAEANLCGTPVIVQKATGFSTQVIEGENGYLINYEKSDEAKAAILHAIQNRITKEQIQACIHSEKRWDAGLPNLEEEILKMARIGGDKSQWGSGHIPLFIMTPAIIIFYFIFWTIGFPFNKVTDKADGRKVGPAVFNHGRLAPKNSC